MRKYSRPNESTQTLTKNLQTLTLTEMFERFMVMKRLSGLAPRTLSEYEIHFEYLMRYLDNVDCRSDELTDTLFYNYIDFMINEKKLSPMTVNIRIRTLRAFLHYCHDEGLLQHAIYKRLRLLKTEEDAIQSFTPSEIKILLRQIDTSKYVGYRDYTMICVLLDTMVRMSELVAIKRSNVYFGEGVIKLEARNTKTRKGRTVPISSRTGKLLSDYVKETADFGEESLFLSYDGRPLNDATWRDRLRTYGEQAGLSNKRVSPHTFRHTGALLYILNGGDPFSLQKILGHSDMTMVRKYIQMTSGDVKRQHNLYSPLKNIRI